jgi:hypothetical protein
MTCSVQLKSFVEARVRRFIYHYDFGDSWEHEGVPRPRARAYFPARAAAASAAFSAESTALRSAIGSGGPDLCAAGF